MSETAVYQFIHLLFTVFWIGGMAFMAFVLKPAMGAISPAEAGKLMGAVARRFTIIAWLSSIVLLVSGLLKTPSGLLFDTSSAYGTVLLLKHVVFAVMIVNGLIITFGIAPKLRSHAPKNGERPSEVFVGAQKRLGIFSGLNTVLGILVLFLISLV